MSTLSPEQRGDLAEQMLPVAAHLAVLVHGDGGPQDVAEVLEGLDDTQRNALIVVLAGLVDPEQPVGKALGWLDFNEHGSLTVPSWSEERSVRDLAPELAVDADDDYVDQVAVLRFVQGARVDGLTDAEFLAGVQQCVVRGRTLAEIDVLQGWPRRTTENWVNRLRKKYGRSGRAFPSLAQPASRPFSEAEVVAIRERAAGDASDRDIAMSYGVTRETIRAIVTGKRYPNFGGPIRKARKTQSVKASRDFMCGHGANSQASGVWKAPKLTHEDRVDVRQRAGEGEDVKELAAEYQVSTQTIRTYAA
ncbi:hypothetical protein ACFVOR_37390 [Streptomyces sp. NPDC057837]|uniref:hypothetical protein n=1 Tax=Streptomyces sp. NPDC057837 TaxID=3346260 RepID=UPI0036AE6670